MDKILQALSLITVVFSGLIIMWRILSNSGVAFKKIIPERIYKPEYVPNFKDCSKIYGYSMLFRVFILIASLVIFCLFVHDESGIDFGKFINNWIKWDASNYIRISEGYTSYIENGDYPTIVFFPLYSILLKIVRFIIPHPALSGLILSSVLSSLACTFFYKLVCIDYSKKTAELSVILLCLFPFGFFYSSIMSESAFLLTSVMTLYYARRHSWTIASICGMFTALSRSVGVFLIFPVFIELLEETKLPGNIKNKHIWGESIKKGINLLLFPVGTVIYLILNYNISGNPFYFLEMEEKYWHQVTQPFFVTAGNFWNIITGGYKIPTIMASFLPGFVLLIFAYAVLVRGLTKHKTMYVSWLLIYIMVNTTMSWPLSFCRYIACGVPLYIIIADECEKKPKLSLAFIISWSILFGIYFTGYLTGKQIM